MPSTIGLAGCDIHMLASAMTFLNLNQMKAWRVPKYLSDLILVDTVLLFKLFQNVIKPYEASNVQ